MFNRKFGNSKVHPKTIDDMDDSQTVSDLFAKFFCKNMNYDNALLRASQDNDLMHKLSLYNGSNYELVLEVQLVDFMIFKLKKGKAAGIDGLTCEHLQNCHPIVITMLTKLFNLMIKYSFVPNDFGLGIIILIPKGESKGNKSKVEDFRGIILSPILSKILKIVFCIIWKIFYRVLIDNLGLRRELAAAMQFMQSEKLLTNLLLIILLLTFVRLTSRKRLIASVTTYFLNV